MVKPSLPLRLGDIRKQNERLILDMFFDNDRYSQSEAALSTGLKPSTVLNIFNSLVEYGDIILCKEENSGKSNKLGRRPLYYRINPNAHYIIGISFDEKDVAVVCVDFGLKIIYSKAASFHDGVDVNSIIDTIQSLVDLTIEQTKIDKNKLLGIGVCLPGTFDLRSQNLLWYPYISGLVDENTDISDKLRERYELPVLTESNTRANATYLARYGQCQNLKSFLYIALTSTVDAAFYSSDTNDTEQNAFIELLNIGHLPIIQDSNLCSCGGRGCLNASLSTYSILEDFGKLGNNNCIQDVVNTVRGGSASAVSLFIEKSMQLSNCIDTFNTLLLPQQVVIMTDDQELSELLSGYCYKNFKDRYQKETEKSYFFSIPKIVPTGKSLINQARFAVDLILDDFFGTPLLPWSRPWKKPGILK